MSKRQHVVAIRTIQFIILLGAVVGGVAILLSGVGNGDLFGISNKAIFGTAGILLLGVVAYAGSKILYSNLPPEDFGEPDIISKHEGSASTRVLGSLAEQKYGTRKAAPRGPSMSEYYGFGRKQ